MSLAQARAALAGWEIGEVTGLEAVPQGSVNMVFRVRSEAGVFYLRLYRVTDVAVLEREAVAMGAA